MMFSSRRRNKSSVSERSGFLGFMGSPPAAGRGGRESYSLKAANGRLQIARFPTSQRGIPAIPISPSARLAPPPQSLRQILTDDWHLRQPPAFGASLLRGLRPPDSVASALGQCL